MPNFLQIYQALRELKYFDRRTKRHKEKKRCHSLNSSCYVRNPGAVERRVVASYRYPVTVAASNGCEDF
jgi:hypothetical protein